MAGEVLKSVDVLKANLSEEMLGMVEEVVTTVPELDFFEASPVSRNTYKALSLTDLPVTKFRKPEEDRELGVPKLGERTIACAYLDASWVVPGAVAEQSDWSKEFVFAMHTKSHLQSAFLTLAKQVWNGVKSDPNGFIGFKALLDALPELNVTVAGTTTDLSSVYAVSTGIDSAQFAWGSEGRFDEGPVTEIWTPGAAANTGSWKYAQKLGGWVGLQVTSKWACGRISGLSKGAGKTLTDDLVYQLLERFPAGKEPKAFFMSKRSLYQLRSSRTATNATGVPAPIPTEVAGIPIYVTSAITDKEELLV